MKRCQQHYGDVFTLRVANERTWVMLADPGAVREVFTGDPRILHAGEGNAVLRPVLGSHSILLLDDERHMSQRKLMLPAFHGERMQRYGELMRAAARREIETWPTGEPFTAWPRMQAITLEVIMRAIFGVEDGDALGRLRTALHEALDWTSRPRRLLVLAMLGPQRAVTRRIFSNALSSLDELVFAEIRRRRSATGLGEREDIMSLLVQARYEDGTSMGDIEIRDELMTLLVAGHETTATALAWALERLVRHPPMLERLRAEVEAGEDLYLDAVVKETLRLRPVLPIVLRQLKAPVEIAGHLIPEGVALAPCIYLVHRHPSLYPEPERFRPERFLEQATGPYSWIPFGGGVRRCLGASFALFEMKTVLSEIVIRANLSPAERASEPVARRTITLTPGRGARLIARPRAGRGPQPASEPALNHASARCRAGEPIYDGSARRRSGRVVSKRR